MPNLKQFAVSVAVGMVSAYLFSLANKRFGPLPGLTHV
jgi:hypothetical protein